jgi:glycosyltransferase involved in cell wall biosynthesis
MPSISLIIPVHNAAASLPNVIESLLAQTLTDLEIILVDDASTDDSPQLCRTFAERHSSTIIAHCCTTQGGPGRARNKGIALATGKYVGFVDADDSVHTDMFALLYAAAEKIDAECAVCGIQRRCGAQILREDVPAQHLDVAALAAERRIVSPLWNKIIRRDWLEAQQLRCAETFCAEDAAFVLKMLSRKPTIASVPFALYTYAIHEQGLSAPLSRRKQVLMALEDVQDYIQQHPPLLPFSRIYWDAVVMHALYHPLCLLCIESLWRGKRRKENCKAAPAYFFQVVSFFYKQLLCYASKKRAG